MKNLWMSWWLSEANKAASAGRAFWAAEMTRQQNAMMKAWMDAWLAGFHTTNRK